jgi:hypothetical protein
MFKEANKQIDTLVTHDNKKDFEDDLKTKIDSILIKELYTEFVLADTNWGDGKEKQLHVVAPNPKTGEPQLWRKLMPEGKMEPMGEEWLKGNWSSNTKK